LIAEDFFNLKQTRDSIYESLVIFRSRFNQIDYLICLVALRDGERNHLTVLSDHAQDINDKMAGLN